VYLATSSGTSFFKAVVSSLLLVEFAHLTIDCGLLVAIYAKMARRQGQQKAHKMDFSKMRVQKY